MFVPAVVDLFPVHVEVRVELAGVREGVAEPLHGAAPAACRRGPFGGPAHRAGLGDGQAVEAEPRARTEGVPGLGELARVVGDLTATPFAHLADDDALTGERVLPLQGDVSAVVGEQELAQNAGAGSAQRVAVPRQHHREDQLEQDRLAAAVLQEQHARGRRAPWWADGLVLEELGLGRGGPGHGLTDSAQVQHGVGVARTGGSDGVEADPGQLVHGGGLSSFRRGGRLRLGRFRSGRGGPRRRPVPGPRCRAGAAGWPSRP